MLVRPAGFVPELTAGFIVAASPLIPPHPCPSREGQEKESVV